MLKAMLCALIWAALTGAGQAQAQGKTMTLAADRRLEASGLLDFLVPRFALKTGIRVTLLPGDADALSAAAAEGRADALLGAADLAGAVAARDTGTRLRPAFHEAEGAADGAGAVYAVIALPGGAGAEQGARFAEWLTSEIGQRTIAQFAPEGGARYLPGARKVAAAPAALPEGDVDAGERLSLVHCGRCHVVSERNRFSGIGSTPSFAAMRARQDWETRFRNFWAKNPHPSFTQVEGLTRPFDPAAPPHIAPVEITQHDLDAIVAYAAALAPKDLGAAIEPR